MGPTMDGSGRSTDSTKWQHNRFADVESLVRIDVEQQTIDALRRRTGIVPVNFCTFASG